MVTYDATTRTIMGLNPNLPDGDVNLIIPSNINGMEVDSIGRGAFRDNKRIVNLGIAEGIKGIGDSAFVGIDGSGATGTSGERVAGELVIPNSVVIIGHYAFANSGFSGSLTIGESVKTIGEGAFANMVSITIVIFKSSEPPVIGMDIFSGIDVEELKITVPDGALESYTDLDNLEPYTDIVEEAEEQTLGTDQQTETEPTTEQETETTQAGQQTYTVSFNTNGGTPEILAQDNISPGGTVTEPTDNITKPDSTFDYWYTDDRNSEYDFATEVQSSFTLSAKWTAVVVQPPVPQPQTYTVSFDTKGGSPEILAQDNISPGGTVTEPTDNITKPDSIFGYWYKDDRNTAYVFATTEVQSDFTLYARWLADTYMVTYDLATRTITGLNPALPDGDVDLVIPANIAGIAMDRIGNNAFENNRRIVSLRIDEGIRHIGAGAFNGCRGFTGSLTIPSSVVTIGERAFEDCSGFTGSLTIPSSVVTIGERAFEDCRGFTGSLTIPNSVVTIGERAFKGCSGFTGGLTIPDGVETIEGRAFERCSGFTGSLTIPNSVGTIEHWAFSRMTSIDSFIFESSTPPRSIGVEIFQDIPLASLNIIVPDAEAVTAYRGVTNLSRYRDRIRVAR